MKGKVIAITGAFGALGKVVAEIAVQRGASIAALDFASKPPEGLADRLGTGALLLGSVDLTSAERARHAIEQIVARFGRLDALLNIAGGFVWEKIEGAGPANWERLFAMNLLTALNASRAAIPHLMASGSGRIVNVGANSAVKAAVGFGPYAASKGAVHRLTESLADELKLLGITVNAVLPSIIDTPGNRADMPQGAFETWVSPVDLAAVMLFLASDEARAVTGALIPVTGKV